EKPREALVDRRGDSGHVEEALDQDARAIADHRGDRVGRKWRTTVLPEQRVAGCGEILHRVDERAIEIEDDRIHRAAQRASSPVKFANEVGVSQTVTRTTGSPALVPCS